MYSTSNIRQKFSFESGGYVVMGNKTFLDIESYSSISIMHLYNNVGIASLGTQSTHIHTIIDIKRQVLVKDKISLLCTDRSMDILSGH